MLVGEDGNSMRGAETEAIVTNRSDVAGGTTKRKDQQMPHIIIIIIIIIESP